MIDCSPLQQKILYETLMCEIFMYYWMPLPVASLRQLLVSFHNIGKLQDPAAACPIFVS